MLKASSRQKYFLTLHCFAFGRSGKGIAIRETEKKFGNAAKGNRDDGDLNRVRPNKTEMIAYICTCQRISNSTQAGKSALDK